MNRSRGYRPVIEAFAPELRDDLTAGAAEGRGELLRRHDPTVLPRDVHPALLVRQIGVDQDSVDVKYNPSPDHPR